MGGGAEPGPGDVGPLIRLVPIPRVLRSLISTWRQARPTEVWTGGRGWRPLWSAPEGHVRRISTSICVWSVHLGSGRVDPTCRAWLRTAVDVTDARTLLDWAAEVGLPGRGPEAHPERPFGPFRTSTSAQSITFARLKALEQPAAEDGVV